MKVTFLFILFFLLGGCSPENNQPTNSLSDFIKADYSHYQSTINCELLPDKNLSSVERFIPLLVDNLNKARNEDDEIIFFFPIQAENSNILRFKIVLNHKDELFVSTMNKSLLDLSFEDTALCKTEESIYGRLSLHESNLGSNLLVTEMMSCNYFDNFNYATMKLVFEEFADALIKIDQSISIIYLENLKDKSKFKWLNVFESLDSRKRFVKYWQDLSVSNKIQTVLSEQSSCGASSLFESYKVI